MKLGKEMKKHDLVFGENILFLGLICLIIIFGMVGFVRTQRAKSDLENRVLAQFEHFTIDRFIDGSFQENFENAISDQFLMSETIRFSYGEVIGGLPNFGINNLFCTSRYVEVPSSTKDKRKFFDCGDYMVSRPLKMSESEEKAYRRHIANYNKINEMADVYYYFVSSYNNIDFETGEYVVDAEKMLREDLEGTYTLSTLKVDNYEQYKNYYYKTDHHWDYRGSYEGYLGIAEMMGIKNPTEKPAVLTNHDVFYGSHANVTLYYGVKEEFCFYDFEFAEHDTYINGKKSEYGNLKKYKNHDYGDKNPAMGYYEYVYGGNNGEVIFDYHNPEAENLLIISNSFGNPIKSLVAQHFNKTYAVDLRNYKKAVGEDFSIQDYVSKHKISKILFVMTTSFLYSDDVNNGLEC